MRQVSCLFFSILAFVLSNKDLQASHIVGGDINLLHVADDLYTLEVQVFRDCEFNPDAQKAPFNDSLYIGMYQISDHQEVRRLIIPLAWDSVKPLKFGNRNCVDEPDICTEIGYYKATFSFPASAYSHPSGYYFSWERCCRNAIINNIRQPGKTGMTFYIEVPPFTVRNSSPDFKRDPLTILCINNYHSIDYRISDPDKDSLVISLVDPLRGTLNPDTPNSELQKNRGLYPIVNSGPYPPVLWRDDFSSELMIDGWPPLSIDSQSGVLTVQPKKLGTFVIAVRIEEFRNGRKLGEVRRELQVQVANCARNKKPEFDLPIADTTFIAYATDNFCQEIKVLDLDKTDSLFLSAESEIFIGGTQTPYATMPAAKGYQKAITKLCWSPTCEQIREEKYFIDVYLSDDGCPLPKTTFGRIKVVVDSPPVPPPPKMVCIENESENALWVNWGRVQSDRFFSHFILRRINPDGDTILLENIYDKGITSYKDSTAYNHGKQDYCYFLSAVNTCGKEGEPSYSFCSASDYAVPPAPVDVSAVSVEGEKQLKITWRSSGEKDFYNYLLYRTDQDSEGYEALIDVIAGRADTVFNDNQEGLDDREYCYKVAVTDQCGSQSELSVAGCNMILKGTVKPFINSLAWQPYRTWKDQNENYVVMRSKDGEKFEPAKEFSGIASSHDDEIAGEQRGISWYQVIARKGEGKDRAVSKSNVIELVQTPIAYIPDAASPNNDGVNDDWDFLLHFSKSFDLMLYTRWGQLVYSASKETYSWEQLKSNVGSATELIYSLEIIGYDNLVYPNTGVLHLLR